MKNQKVRPVRLNWDIECYYDIINSNGFMITEPATFQFDDTKQKSLYGARSILYGTSYEDETAFIEGYRCKCGEFKGTIFEGEICPLCKHKVEKRDADIEFTGWISLGQNYVLNPYYYNKLEKCIGKTNLEEIVATKRKVDVNGSISETHPDDYNDEPIHPYVGIGLIEFRKRFEEVLNYFKGIKKNKASEIDKVISESSAVFCCHIPIYSTLLRPQSYTSDTYYFNSIDKHINPLFSLSEKIKDAQDIDKFYILSRIQYRVNTLWEKNLELLKGKKGFIRGEILGGSLNYTARNVIIPDPTLRDDEVDLSYHTFLEIFKFKIIYYLMNMEDISLGQAYSEWSRAYRFSNKIYEVMQFIVKKEQPKILMNRNPTLNYYSMLLMSIRQVKKDIDDYTLSVPLSVLPGLNADFDGDILNMIGIMSEELKYAFRKFDPVDRMIISRDANILNDYFTITKSQLIDLYYFCTID